MPLKIKRAFEREYGKKLGDKYFYSWENKRGISYKRKKNKWSSAFLH